jgi:hypothetical protein
MLNNDIIEDNGVLLLPTKLEETQLKILNLPKWVMVILMRNEER